MTETIAFLNETASFTDAGIAPIMAAIQEDDAQNCALWQLQPATFIQVPKGDAPPAGTWQMAFLDNSDEADALGYHELTWDRMPLGKVFVLTTQKYQQQVSRVASHETWEMRVDPWLNRLTPKLADGREYVIEVGDLLSLDQQGRTGLGGVLLSGIALPAAYFPNYGTRYDIGGRLSAPLPNVAPKEGAYLMWDGGQGWECHIPPTSDHNEFLHMQAQRGSRRHRRVMDLAKWRNSTRWARP